MDRYAKRIIQGRTIRDEGEEGKEERNRIGEEEEKGTLLSIIYIHFDILFPKNFMIIQ